MLRLRLRATKWKLHFMAMGDAEVRREMCKLRKLIDCACPPLACSSPRHHDNVDRSLAQPAEWIPRAIQDVRVLELDRLMLCTAVSTIRKQLVPQYNGTEALLNCGLPSSSSE